MLLIHDLSFAEGDLDVFDADPPPPVANIEYLVERTRFTRTELKAMYRNFKQSSPNGWLSEAQLAEDLIRIFPRGGTIVHALRAKPSKLPSCRSVALCALCDTRICYSISLRYQF